MVDEKSPVDCVAFGRSSELGLTATGRCDEHTTPERVITAMFVPPKHSTAKMD